MAALVHSEPRIVDRRLSQQFNSTRSQWIEVVKAGVRARAGCTDNDAKSAPGYYAWNAATAEMRRIFGREGWERGELNGIETIIHRELGKTIAVMNTDARTCHQDYSPRNRTPKGPASEKIVDLNSQYELYPPSVMRRPTEPVACPLWYLCLHDDKGLVRAELSRPVEYEGGYVTKFAERIFILRDGDWDKVTIDTGAHDGPGGQEFDIQVRRK